MIGTSYAYCANDVLQGFLETTLETALVLEADVDFDLNIESQATLFAQTLASDSDAPGTTEDPWSHNTWNVLWLGHMGVELSYTSELEEYQDPFALPFERLISGFNDLYAHLRDTSRSQLVVRNAAPMASWAYVVNRQSAHYIIDAIQTDRRLLDETIHILCKGSKLRCVARVPELFHQHHVVGASGIDVDAKDDGIQDLRWAGRRHQYTYNIQWSAQCNAAGIGERLGSLWQCMPSQYDHMI